MQFSIKKEIIEPLINLLQPFLDKKDASQITAHILLEVQNGILTLHATDYEMGLKITQTSINIKEEGKITANGKKLVDIIRTLKNGDIHFKKDGENLQISQNKSRFKLPTFIAEEFPKIPDFSNFNYIDFPISDIFSAFKKALPIIDNSATRIEITGILINIQDNKIEFVATDTRRLGIISQDCHLNPTHFIIPKKTLTESLKIEFTDAKIYHSQADFVIFDSSFTFYSKLINGQYPEYQKIIPKNLEFSFELPRDTFLDSIRLISSLSQNIKVIFNNNEITFCSLNSDAGETAETSIEFPTNLSEPLTIALNSKNLLDFLSHIQSPTFKFKINEPNTPFLLESQDFITIIIPIIL
ncbi:DNA polymerase III subunit beta [Helicobacter monodelphidis]|uniref:DNA polymerase III subunit beta n=1 Tax=Helicobacter sp. 15-1451 TaxID=2004995 RepID=UPI000DCC8D18|nr:DNA polymerase III subunit beta [Helicobacter sp. 15-1451]RAX56835.1 DNA polymerase III subunit beta [Helicobacter sp. 15-1451]